MWLIGCIPGIFTVMLDITLFLHYHRRYDEGVKLV